MVRIKIGVMIRVKSPPGDGKPTSHPVLNIYKKKSHYPPCTTNPCNPHLSLVGAFVCLK